MRVLLVAAHPDDTEFICGGTIASLISDGAEVNYVVTTSGESGLPTHVTDRSLREEEQSSAAQVLGVANVSFLRFPDGGVEPGLALRRQLVCSIRALKPQVLITHSPDRNYSSIRFSHPDHLAVGAAALAAVYPDARNEGTYPDLLEQGLEPYSVPEVWLHGSERSDMAINITEHFEIKLKAVSCHKSQLYSFGDVPKFFREWAAEVAQRHALPSDLLAEQYLRLDTK